LSPNGVGANPTDEVSDGSGDGNGGGGAGGARPGLLLVWRDTVPGHSGCDATRLGRPFPTSRDAELGLEGAPWFDGRAFAAKNAAALGLAAASGFHRLETYGPTLRRRDAHIGHGDCLHYCLPGPSSLWCDLLAELVVDGGKRR
jgi:hypothetical protein